jgi:carbamoyltransferase
VYILGIAAYGQHDSGICLLRDGQILYAIEEEKLSRQRHDNRFPRQALDDCLNRFNLDFSDIDQVGFYSDLTSIPLDAMRFMVGYFPKSLRFLKKSANFFSHLQIEYEIKKTYGFRQSIHYIKHHTCHAASAFYPSNFESAALLSLDGTGEWTTTWLGLGEGHTIKNLKTIAYPHSLGRLYETITQYLGFMAQHGEGKVMGLASYGEPAYADLFTEMVRLRPAGEFELNLDYFDFPFGSAIRYSPLLVKKLGPPRLATEPITKRHEDIAASLQKCLEQTAIHIANYLYEATHQDNLCIAGGVGLNSQMNAVLLERTPFKQIFVQPAAYDPGTALGAALYIHHQILGHKNRRPMTQAAWGPEYDETSCREAIEKAGLAYAKTSTPTRECARLLNQGKVVGWFQGPAEFGPRALGNRSILADPRQASMKDIINAKIKHREPFRPFAPAVLEEKAGDFFSPAHSSPFMLFVKKTFPEKMKLIPAVVHVDGSARVQTVSRTDTPLFHELISEFYKLTGMPILLNTSLNIKGEPIAITPAAAIHSFLDSQLDALFLGNFLLTKTE